MLPFKFLSIATIAAVVSCGSSQSSSPSAGASGGPSLRTAAPRISPPVPVPGLDAACRDGVASVSTGWSHSCALCKSGEVACWGTNFLGNLGVPLPTERPTPVVIAGLKDVREVAAGSYHTCARLASGRATCWGANNDGQLGDDTEATRLHPVPVSDLDDAQQIDVGLGPGHSCVVVKSGKVRCWGVNFNSQLGDGTMTNRAAPADVEII